MVNPHSGSPASPPISGQATRPANATIRCVGAHHRPIANTISNSVIACVRRFITYSDCASKPVRSTNRDSLLAASHHAAEPSHHTSPLSCASTAAPAMTEACTFTSDIAIAVRKEGRGGRLPRPSPRRTANSRSTERASPERPMATHHSSTAVTSSAGPTSIGPRCNRDVKNKAPRTVVTAVPAPSVISTSTAPPAA